MKLDLGDKTCPSTLREALYPPPLFLRGLFDKLYQEWEFDGSVRRAVSVSLYCAYWRYQISERYYAPRLG